MHRQMSQLTRKEVLNNLRRRYARAGKDYKSRLITEVVELLGYHRKAAIRALQARPPQAVSAPAILGRPQEYHPEKLLGPLKAIWLAALQPCGKRLVAALPEWLPAYEEEHRPLETDTRQALLRASAATLDRLLRPARVAHRRRAATRPGTILRQEIAIRTDWQEEEPGFLEIDTVALCGGVLDDRHAWMFDSVDIVTTWTELRALENRSQHCTITQLGDVEKSLPFALAGLDFDNGGEFMNLNMRRFAGERPRPLCLTRARAYHKNDNAHIEQKNYTQVRQWFGYERYDNPAVVPLINQLCKGALGQLLNYFLPTMKLEDKRQEGSRWVRVYGKAQTPLARVLASDAVPTEKKNQLRAQHAALNPFALRREVDRQMKAIERARRLHA
jgi:hypothetical protein